MGETHPCPYVITKSIDNTARICSWFRPQGMDKTHKTVRGEFRDIRARSDIKRKASPLPPNWSDPID
jgi:hypothetical protein